MARIPDSTVSEAVGMTADPLDELVPDYTPLIRRIGDARFPLLGEASHGTHEFYRERARITKRLIEHTTSSRWPSRATGPTPPASIGTSAAPATTPTPTTDEEVRELLARAARVERAA